MILLVSGAPGSGKSTVAAELQSVLGWPLVNRDELYAGLAHGLDVDRSEAVRHGIRLFWEVTAGHARAGCSVIADATLYRGQSERDVAELLLPVGRVRNLHCRSSRAFERFVARGHDATMNDRVAANAPLVEAPLDLGVPLLEVDTDDGYSPGLATIVDWARAG